MSEQEWSGSFAIPMTPYDERGRIDEDVLAAEIEFCIEAGAGGLVVPVMVSEFQALTEAERRTMIEVPLAVNKGRIPIIVNVAAVATHLAVEYAELANECGADGVIAMPPYGLPPDFGTTADYFRSIAGAVSVPVWIQNAGVASLTLDEVVSLCETVENISWVKEEVNPSPGRIGALVERGSSGIRGVMGGSGGRFLITEWERGAKGVVHACEFCDVIAGIWKRLEQGDLDEAARLYEAVLPGLVMEGLMGMAFAKEIMVRRGVFRNHRMRSQAAPLNAHDLAEIDRIWGRLESVIGGI